MSPEVAMSDTGDEATDAHDGPTAETGVRKSNHDSFRRSSLRRSSGYGEMEEVSKKERE